MTIRFKTLLMTLSGVVCLLSPVKAADIRYPADAGIINITQPPYNAKGDGVTDNTAAINAALRDWNYARSHELGLSPTIYFPKGIYLVSDTLIPMDPNGKYDQCSVRIFGESRDDTVILLKDRADGFGNPKKPKYVLKTGNRPRRKDGILIAGPPNMGFGNYIQNLTVNVGAQNPGAVGIRYDVANWGTMEHVNIISPTGIGHSGLLFYSVCGSGYVKDVRIQGFDYGVHFDDTAVNNIVFEHLVLENQNVCGILNQGKNIQIRDLKSFNKGPALRSKNPWAATVLIDADLTSTENSNVAAIDLQDDGFLFIRDATVSGYASAIAVSSNAAQPGVSGRVIQEWVSHDGPVQRTATDSMTLRLPVKESPEYHNNDFSQWANICDYGATRDDDTDDDAPAIQAAIDSGKEIVYFPFGQYSIASSVIIRGAVKKIDGVFSKLMKPDDNELAVVRISDVDGGMFIFENITTENIPLIYDSADTVVIRHKPLRGLIECGSNAHGDLFIENVGPHVDIRISNGIHVWMRQINREVDGLTNDGSQVWLLGDNVERMYRHSSKRLLKKPFRTINGGKTEVLGGAMDVLWYRHPAGQCALFEVVDSDLSVMYAGESRRRDGELGTWCEHVMSSQSNVVEQVMQDDLIMRLNGVGNAGRFVLPWYRTP